MAFPASRCPANGKPQQPLIHGARWLPFASAIGAFRSGTTMPKHTIPDADLVPINQAVFLIGSETDPVDPATIRRAAERIGKLTENSQGRKAIPRTVVEQFRELRRVTGYFTPRRTCNGAVA